ncbi:MAG: DUF2079 domain-containing protein [Planctomycetota bacterium]
MSPETPTRWWPWVFWAFLFAGGLSILQLSSGEIRVAGATYAARPWAWHGWLTAAALGGLCWLGAVLDSGRSTRRRAQAIALWPILGVALVAALQSGFGVYHFIQLPVAIALIGWCVGRWVAVSRRGSEDDRASSGWPFLLVTALAVAFASVWFVALQHMSAGGHLGYADVGIFASRLINTARGTFLFRENATAVAFWDHFNPGFYVLVPLVMAFNANVVLNAVGSISAAAPALVWYWFARSAGWPVLTSCALALGWLLLPSLSHPLFSMSFGFHPMTMAMPLVAVSLVLLTRGRVVGFALCAILACTFRETVALSYVGVGLWLLCTPRRRRTGAVVLTAAAVYFAIITAVVIPYFRGGTGYLGAERFGHLGGSAAGILLSPVAAPRTFWGLVASNESLTYCAVLFGCLGLVPILYGGRRLLMILPEGVFLLLWHEPLVRSIAYHYHLIVLVLLYWLSIDGLSAVLRRGGGGAARSATGRAWVMIGSAVAGSFYLGWWPQLRDTTPFDRLPARRETMNWIRARVTEDDSVAATWRAASHCSRAASIHILPSYEAEVDAWPDVFVLDYADDWGRFDLGGWLPPLRRWHRRLMESSYVVVASREEVVVYRRTGVASAESALAAPAPPLESLQNLPAHLTPDLTLLGWTLAGAGGEADPGEDSGSVRVTAFLRVESAPATDLGIALSLRHVDYPDVDIAHSFVRPAGGMRHTSTAWTPGQITAEGATMAWLMPQPPRRAALTLVVHLYDLDTGHELQATLCP